MKDLLKNGALILLFIAVLYIIFLRECKRTDTCPPDGQMLIAQTTWDSILAIANTPGEVRIDTVWLNSPYTNPNPQPPLPDPEPIDNTDIAGIIAESNDGIFLYRDSLIQPDINVWSNLTIRGELLAREWGYKPIVSVVTRDSIIYVPSIVEIERVVTKPVNGLFLYGTAGGNADSFLFGGGIDFISKQNMQYGYMYQRYGTMNFHSVKVGFKITFKR